MGRRSGNQLIKNCDVHSSAAVGLAKLATGALPTGITVTTANVSGEIAADKLPVTSRLHTTTPAAKGASVNDVATALSGDSATMTFTIAGGAAALLAAAPRNVRVKGANGWDGGVVTVTGTDQFDAACVETFAQADVANATKVGVKIFKTVTSITKSAVGASAAAATVGVGDTIGIPFALSNLFYLFTKNVSGTVTFEAATVESTYHSFVPTTTPDGTAIFTIIANF
jgi:hypothetical protein